MNYKIVSKIIEMFSYSYKKKMIKVLDRKDQFIFSIHEKVRVKYLF